MDLVNNVKNMYGVMESQSDKGVLDSVDVVKAGRDASIAGIAAIATYVLPLLTPTDFRLIDWKVVLSTFVLTFFGSLLRRFAVDYPKTKNPEY